MDFSATKGKVISQNIANVDTPNYKAKNVSFKEVFANVQVEFTRSLSNRFTAYRISSQQRTHPGVFNYSNLRYRHDGNGVDMDKEQADLAANQIYYNALVDRINGKFNTLQNVIKGGR